MTERYEAVNVGQRTGTIDISAGMWECKTCYSIIRDMGKHDAWHRRTGTSGKQLDLLPDRG